MSTVTKEGKKARLEAGAIDDLQAGIRGAILQPGDADYDDARRIWNAMIDRRPALIVRCRGVADVMRSVAFARDQGISLAVRGGGHNIAGNCICDGGLVIDCSLMRSVHVQPDGSRATVEPGATLADIDHETQAFGLAVPLGINSTTGIAGLTLGGGFGWLTRRYGMTVDNLLSADVVTADGKFLRASADQNPDLFWGIRGGGGNFGIVTSFEFQLHPFGPDVFAGLIVFPFEDAKKVLLRYRELTEMIPEELNVWIVLRKAPPLPFLPTEVHGKEIVVAAVFYAGDDPEMGKEAIVPLSTFGERHGEHLGVQPYTAWQKAFDPLLTPGARNYWKSHNFSRLTHEAIDAIVEQAKMLPSPECEIFVGLLGGEASRVPPDAMAYAHRDAQYVMNVHSRWEKPEDDERCISWAREVYRATAPYATGGVYVNFMTEEEIERVPAAYGTNYARMVELKKKYDPENLFRLNQNIRPRI
jgi:FAD/FMN-containing dehydrogenase